MFKIPVHKVGHDWYMGSKKFSSKAKAEKAYKAYLAQKHKKGHHKKKRRKKK